MSQSSDLIANVERFGTENRVNPKALKVSLGVVVADVRRRAMCLCGPVCVCAQSIAKSLLVFFKESVKSGVTAAQLREDLIGLRTCWGE